MLLKYLYLSLFSGNIWEWFKVQLSVAVFVYILLSKEANQLHELFIRTLGNNEGHFSTEAAVLKCISSNFVLEIWRSLRTRSEKLVLENYDLAHHTAIRTTPRILIRITLVLFCVFHKSKSWRYNIGYNLMYWPEF